MGRFFIHALVLSCIILLSSCNANDDSRSDPKEDEKHYDFQHQRLSPVARFPPQLLQLLPGSGLDNQVLSDGDGIYGVEEPVMSTFFHQNDEDEYAEDPEYDMDPELQSNLPYGIQNVRRNVEMMPSRSIRTKGKITRTSFQSLCPSRRTLVYLNGENGYEYKPDHYEEVTCQHPFTSFRDYRVHRNKPALSRLIDGNMDEICGDAGFSCIQLNRTIFLTRRLYGTECWESLTRQVPAGCECMWPKHHYGDITSHH
ncbi:uncharacterized protein LOC129809409 isoform X1 [Phlebotomus papatasi]|uniref:uncharacterized protein LOC129809409 isoform X1 n=1 Tax=Phlebotomus papatasi TaxID=29031 RepID=UPI0024834030|nr:uncharacterized protein LOC129809409 isoform X1 [Phlebotomus papatasi]